MVTWTVMGKEGRRIVSTKELRDDQRMSDCET